MSDAEGTPAAMAPRSSSRDWTAERSLKLQLLYEILEEEEQVCRTFGEAAHEVRVPLRAEGDVNAHAPALAGEPLLQVAADAIEHLELESVGGDAAGAGIGEGRINDALVVGGDGVVKAAVEEALHQGDVVGVHGGFFLQREGGWLAVGALDQTHADAGANERLDIGGSAMKIGLDHGADVGACGVELLDQFEGGLSVGGALHVHADEGVECSGAVEDAAQLAAGQIAGEIEDELGKLDGEVRVHFVAVDGVENGAGGRGGGLGSGLGSDVFAERIEAGGHAELVDGGHGGDGVVEVEAGHEAAGNALAERTVLGELPHGRVAGKSQEDGAHGIS